MSFFDLLKTVPMFSSLSDRELTVIEALQGVETFRRDEVIIKQEETGRSLYVVIEGAVSNTIDTGSPQNPVGRRDSNARLQTAGVAPRQVPPVCPERALGCRNSHGESASDAEPATTQNRRESARERSFAGPGVGTDRYNRRCPR
jgi:fructose-1,6-bisphosphatase/sedoheptulose 1,7-bisphosphatase-like protein